jgi:hypothetical protein
VLSSSATPIRIWYFSVRENNAGQCALSRGWFPYCAIVLPFFDLCQNPNEDRATMAANRERFSKAAVTLVAC